MNNYLLNKERARQKAIEFSTQEQPSAFSFGECYYWSNYFEKLGKKYGLLREFRENGIC